MHHGIGRVPATCPLPKLTSTGGHRNTHSWQADGTHPAGMLSCYCSVYQANNFAIVISDNGISISDEHPNRNKENWILLLDLFLI